VNAANAAASKAAIFKANYKAGAGNTSMMDQTDSSMKAGTYNLVLFLPIS
jgi:hypothetical protein